VLCQRESTEDFKELGIRKSEEDFQVGNLKGESRQKEFFRRNLRYEESVR